MAGNSSRARSRDSEGWAMRTSGGHEERSTRRAGLPTLAARPSRAERCHVRLDRIPARTEGGFHVVVETPRGAPYKLKLDPELAVLTLKRPLPLGFTWPYDFGFVPSTKAPDGDPVD